jgi:hypothetical protein
MCRLKASTEFLKGASGIQDKLSQKFGAGEIGMRRIRGSALGRTDGLLGALRVALAATVFD